MTAIQLVDTTILDEPESMNRTRSNQVESLVLEDGSVSAQSLPLDAKTATRPYETATFGLG